MIEGEAKLEKAIRASHSKERDRRQRLRWTGSTTASYAIDALFLGMFAVSGTIPFTVLFFFVVASALTSAATFALYARGWNFKFREQNVIWPQTAAGVAIHLTVVALAPQIAFPALSNLFIVFAFGFIWLSLRSSLVLWGLSSLSAGILLWAVHDRAGIAASSAAEVVTTWLCFSAVLGRCLLLSIYANDMRTRLAEGRRKLAISLEQIQELVHFDELTRVYNRRTLVQRLDQEASRAERSGAAFTVAIIDLDHFKTINDNHGHGAGDDVLRTFADAVQACTRATDVFGRYGGEEFLLILTDTDPVGAEKPLQRLCESVAARDWSAIAPGLRLTQSIGVAGFRKGERVVQLLRRADVALYEAKRGGRDRIELSRE